MTENYIYLTKVPCKLTFTLDKKYVAINFYPSYQLEVKLPLDIPSRSYGWKWHTLP